MKVLAFRYTDDLPRMQAFLSALGLDVDLVSESGTYVQLDAAAGAAVLHSAASADEPTPAGTTAMSFEADEPLEAIRDRLAAAGFPGAEIVDESFGRSLRITDPDGVAVQVNEAMSDLYGYRGSSAATA